MISKKTRSRWPRTHLRGQRPWGLGGEKHSGKILPAQLWALQSRYPHPAASPWALGSWDDLQEVQDWSGLHSVHHREFIRHLGSGVKGNSSIKQKRDNLARVTWEKNQPIEQPFPCSTILSGYQLHPHVITTHRTVRMGAACCFQIRSWLRTVHKHTTSVPSSLIQAKQQHLTYAKVEINKNPWDRKLQFIRQGVVCTLEIIPSYLGFSFLNCKMTKLSSICHFQFWGEKWVS